MGGFGPAFRGTGAIVGAGLMPAQGDHPAARAIGATKGGCPYNSAPCHSESRHTRDEESRLHWQARLICAFKTPLHFFPYSDTPRGKRQSVAKMCEILRFAQNDSSKQGCLSFMAAPTRANVGAYCIRPNRAGYKPAPTEHYKERCRS